MKPQLSLFEPLYAKERQIKVWDGLSQEKVSTQLETVKTYLNANPYKTLSQLCEVLGYQKNEMSRVLATRTNGKRVFDDSCGKICPISGKQVTAWKNN